MTADAEPTNPLAGASQKLEAPIQQESLPKSSVSDKAGEGAKIKTVKEGETEAQKKTQEAEEQKKARKERYGIKEVEWDEELDGRLFSLASQVEETLLKLQDSGGVETIRQNQLMFLEMMKEARKRQESGSQAFKEPEEIITALGAITTDELMISSSQGIKVVRIDVEEAPSEPDPTEVEERKGLGLVARTAGHLKSLGHPIELGNRLTDTLARILIEPERVSLAEQPSIQIQLEQLSERVIHPYADKVGESQRFKGEGGLEKQLADYFYKVESLKVDALRALGLDPAVDFNLSALRLRTESPIDTLLTTQQDRILKDLLKDRNISQLSNLELIEIQAETVQQSVIESCQEMATQLLSGQMETDRQRDKELVSIKDAANALESGKVGEEASEQLEAKKLEETILEKQISRMEKALGDPADPEDLLTVKIKEYQEVRQARIAAETEFKRFYPDLDLLEEHEVRLNYYLGEERKLRETLGEQTDRRQSLALERDRAAPGDEEYQTLNRQITTLERHIRETNTQLADNQGLKESAELEVRSIRESGLVEKAEQEETERQQRHDELQDQLAKDPKNKLIANQLGQAAANLEQSKGKAERVRNERTQAASKLATAVELEESLKREVQKYLSEFDQTFEAKRGKRVDNLQKRIAKVEEMRSQLAALTTQREELESEGSGEPSKEDRLQAGMIRMIGELNQSAMYNRLLGAVDAKAIVAMGNIRDQHAAQEAIEDAVFDNIEIKYLDEDGNEQERLLSDEEKLNLFTRGEILHVAMESFGVNVDQMLSGQALETYNRYLLEIQIFKEQANELRENRPAPDFEEKIKDLEGQVNIRQEEMQELLADAGFLDILPYLSRNVFATQQFVANSLAYLRAKAARGELYMAPRKVSEVKPKEAEYRVEHNLRTDFGQLEIIPQKGWWGVKEGEKVARYPTLDYDFTTENGIETHIRMDFRRHLPEKVLGEELATDAGLGIESQVGFQVAVRKDLDLWRSLPDDISRYRKGTPLPGWPEGLPQDIVLVAYERNRKIPASRFCDGGWLNYYSKPKEEATINGTMRGLLKSQIPGRNRREANEFLTASLAKEFLVMDEEERKRWFSDFRPLPFNSMGREFIISLEDGQIYVSDKAGKKLKLQNFSSEENFMGLYKAWRGVTGELNENQRRECQGIFEGLHARVGLRLLKSMERKTFGRQSYGS